MLIVQTAKRVLEGCAYWQKAMKCRYWQAQTAYLAPALLPLPTIGLWMLWEHPLWTFWEPTSWS